MSIRDIEDRTSKTVLSPLSHLYTIERKKWNSQKMSGIGYFSHHTILCRGKPFPEPVVRNLGSKLSVLLFGRTPSCLVHKPFPIAVVWVTKITHTSV